MKPKSMQAKKERDDSQPLQPIIQLDEVYMGAELTGENPCRESENQTPFVAAVACDDAGHPVRMNLNVVKGVQTVEITRWARQHATPGSEVVSDGLACFAGVKLAGSSIAPSLPEAARQALQKNSSHGLTP